MINSPAMMWSASFKKDPHALAFLYYYSVTGKTVNTWISKECLLCYDQSRQRSSHKTTNQLLAFLPAVQFCHAWLAFFCNTLTFQKYYWCSRFSRFDCNNVKLWINQCVWWVSMWGAWVYYTFVQADLQASLYSASCTAEWNPAPFKWNIKWKLVSY